MKAFPAVLVITFATSRKEMADERRTMALQILEAFGRFVRKVFVFVLEEYEPKCSLIGTVIRLQCLEHLIHI